MSFRALLNRRVTIVPRALGEDDAHGNEVYVDGDPIEDVWTSRDLLDADEVNTEGDREKTRYVYFFLPSAAAALDRFSRIIDEDGDFEVDGDISIERDRRRRVHHLEVIVKRAGG